MKKTTAFVTTPDSSIFKNRKKEAKFWEKHFDKAWEGGKHVQVKFAKNLSETINIRLDPEVLLRVRDKARERGLGPTQLIRMWIMEKIGNRGISIR